MNYKQRMLYELLELNRKIVLLENFEDKDDLMNKQLNCMVDYENILVERIFKEMEKNNNENK